MSNYYKILGVAVTATEEEIKRAYRDKAKRLHPDVNKSTGSNLRFQLLGEAYQTLVNAGKRSKYDLKLKYGIEALIRQRNREFYKRYGTSPGEMPGTTYHYNFFRSIKRRKKEDKKTIIFENTLFGSMMVIGAFALFFSISDLLSDNIDTMRLGINGMLFSVIYLILLIYGWKLYKKS